MAVTRAEAYTLSFPMYLSATPTALATGLTLSCMVSKDGGAFAATTNAATEPGGQGVYSLALTAAEMDADSVAVIAHAATAVDQVAVLVTDTDIRAEVGLAAANLDAQLAALPTDADVNAACDTAIADAALATAASLATVDGNVDAILEDTATTLPATLATIDGHVSDTFDDVGAVQATVDTVLSDTNELQTDLTNGGRLDLLLDAIRAKTDTLGGAGAIEWSYTLTAVGGVPIADADVWVTTDAVGANVIASGRTDTSGVATFYLDAGTVYVWAQKAGWNFANPDVEVIA